MAVVQASLKPMAVTDILRRIQLDHPKAKRVQVVGAILTLVSTEQLRLTPDLLVAPNP